MFLYVPPWEKFTGNTAVQREIVAAHQLVSNNRDNNKEILEEYNTRMFS